LGPKAPGALSHKHEFIIHWAALGLSATAIAEKSGYTNAWLSILLNNTHVRAAIALRRAELVGQDAQARLRSMSPVALDVVYDTMTSPQSKPNVKLHAALEVLAHAHGKPQQRIEHTDGNLRQLFEMLDKQQYSQATQAAQFEQAQEVPSEASAPQTETRSEGRSYNDGPAAPRDAEERPSAQGGPGV